MRRTVLSAILALWSSLVFSQDLISIRADADYQKVQHTYLFSDSTNSLGAPQVANIPLTKWRKGILATYSKNFEWVLVPFENKSDSSIKRVFYLSNAISHQVDIYFILNGELTERHIPSGLANTSRTKLYNDPGYPYLIDFPAKSELFVLMKVHDPLSSIQVPVHLLSLEKAYANKDKNLMLLYFWMGIVTLSVILSLLLFVNTKQRMFLYYLLFATATAIIITSTTGMVTMLFDSDPNQIVTNYYQYGAVLLIVFMPRFINSLVPIFRMSTVLWKIVRTLGYIGIGIAILYSLPYFKFSFFFTRLFINLVVSFTAITFLYILVTLLIASFRRKSNAIMLFCIYMVYLSLGFVNVILPLFGAKEGALNAIHFVLIGSALETIAFMVFMSQAALSVYKEREILLEQVRENQELVMKAIVKGQEDERNRFSRDLHDGFGQMISALNLNLKGLRSLKNSDLQERVDVFNSSEEILKGMHAELKNICFNLMPQTLVKHGLEAAFSELAQRINASGEKHLEINIHGLDSRLDEIYEISVYRIAQEWINNILKYSDANQITLQITSDSNELTLLIEDNGMGFSKTRLIESAGNGWRNINSRANLISGEVDLDTTEGMRGNTLILNSELRPNTNSRNKYLEEQSKMIVN